MAAHALLYQRQRDRDEHQRVVATPADYAAVHGLVRAAVRVDLDGLTPRAARAYTSLVASPALTRRSRSRGYPSHVSAIYLRQQHLLPGLSTRTGRPEHRPVRAERVASSHRLWAEPARTRDDLRSG